MTDMDKKVLENLSPSNIEIVLAILNLIQMGHDVSENKKAERQVVK